MSTTMKTPGVYIQELDAFGNSVVPVPTAVPAFIGYTEKTSFNGKSLLNKAVKVTSLAEFLLIFGANAPKVQYKLSAQPMPERLDTLAAMNAAGKAAVDKANDKLVLAGGKPLAPAKDVASAEESLQAALSAKGDDAALLSATIEANQAVLNNAKIAAETALVQANKTIAAIVAGEAAGADEATIKAGADAQSDLDQQVEDAALCANGYIYSIAQNTINYRMYSSMKFFYENGGADCFVMSVGKYNYGPKSITDTGALSKAITLFEKETEPTMLVIPDLIEISSEVDDESNLQDKYANAYALQGEMINHCGTMQNRVAILDIPGGFSEPVVGDTSVDFFRNAVTPSIAKFNSYAAAYYPWLHTTVYQSSDVSYANICRDSSTQNYPIIAQMLTNEFTDPKKGIDPKMTKAISVFLKADASEEDLDFANIVFSNLSKSYQMLTGAIMGHMNLMAPSAGMAGIYTTVDNNEGVWIAPANVGIQSTIKPAINIDHATQEDLNVPLNGKSVSAIRAFTGRGNLVWGARTLDGNSNDWRYINVRRTLIYIEQSVQDASKAYVFAPNDAGTWVNVKSMISNFLQGLWNQGGLVGPKPADAFSVSVGLGSTMTGDDILNGIMRVAVKVAVSHPAEFIEITFQQQMQKG